MSMQVKQPSTERARNAKMAEVKVFVVYYATSEIEALPGCKVVHWGAKAAPELARDKLLNAVRSAEQAIAIAAGAPVWISYMCSA